MSCNAWNHSRGCNCGWGGQGYGGGQAMANESRRWEQTSSYTVPNACCPRCAATVFFYRSPFGGAVYFDDLGPPWPKHPCMDPGRQASARLARPAQLRKTSGRELDQGWQPLCCGSVRPHPIHEGIVVLTSEAYLGGIRLFARTDRGRLDHRTPFLVRRTSARSTAFEISTLDVLAEVPPEIRFIAHQSLLDVPGVIVFTKAEAPLRALPPPLPPHVPHLSRPTVLKRHAQNPPKTTGARTDAASKKFSAPSRQMIAAVPSAKAIPATSQNASAPETAMTLAFRRSSEKKQG